MFLRHVTGFVQMGHTLLKVVSYYDLSVLSIISMSVMGFQKKKFGWGVGGGGVRSIQVFGIFLPLQSPLDLVRSTGNMSCSI